jgi:hypothetical protein
MKTEHKDESGNWEYGKNNQETHLIFLIFEYVRKEKPVKFYYRNSKLRFLNILQRIPRGV